MTIRKRENLTSVVKFEYYSNIMAGISLYILASNGGFIVSFVMATIATDILVRMPNVMAMPKKHKII